MNDEAHTYSIASARNAASITHNPLIETSAACGWTSLLIDHHEGIGRSDIFETHGTNDVAVIMATSGKTEVETFYGGQWRSALYQPGSACLTPPDEAVRMRWQASKPDQAFRTLHLYLPRSLVNSIADEYSRIGRPVSTDTLSALAFRDETVTVQMSALLAAYRAGEPDLYAAGAARWLATHLLSHQAEWQHLAHDSRMAGTITDRRLARVIEFMSCHLDSPLSLAELAREAAISVHHFGRRFREKTGLGPSAFLTTLRIDRARLLLRTTDLPIADVAIRCGYPRASAFSTAFLRHTGWTPRTFRSER